MKKARSVLWAGLLLLVCAWPVSRARAETYTVTTEADDNGPCEPEDCALREALLAANDRPGPDVVVLPVGTYRIEIPGPPLSILGEAGRFGISDDLELVGAPGARIDGNGLDSVIFIFDCTVTISNLIVTGGMGNGLGGGIRISSADVTIVDSTIRGNATDRHGGGFDMALGSLTLINSTVVGNSAANRGGGIYRFGITNFPGEVRIINSTISGNSAREGGGIHINGFGPLTVSSSTIANNTVSFRSDAVFTQRTQPPVFTNTLVSGACGFLFQSPISHGGNIESPGTNCRFTHPTDRMGVPDPGLGPLASNGGPTLTHALLPGSPAIDTAVDGQCPMQDQRGRPRPADGDGDDTAACDVGAFERQPVEAVGEVPALGRVAQVLLVVTLAVAGGFVLARRTA